MDSLNTIVNEDLGILIVLKHIVDCSRMMTREPKSSYDLFAQNNFRVWLVLAIVSTGIDKIILNKGLSV